MQETRGLKGLLMGQLDSRSTDAGTRVLATAESLKRIAGELQGDELSRGAASLATRGAENLERIGTYLKESDGNRLVIDAERLGRTRPWVVATTGFVLGLAGSRMLKASALRRSLGGEEAAMGYRGSLQDDGLLADTAPVGRSNGNGAAKTNGSGWSVTSAPLTSAQSPSTPSESAAKPISRNIGAKADGSSITAALEDSANNDDLNRANREIP